MILGFSIIAIASHKSRSHLILILLFRTLQFKIYFDCHFRKSSTAFKYYNSLKNTANLMIEYYPHK